MQVQKTNDSCIVSKCSMSKQGYFDDEVVSSFVQKQRRRSPLINRGYYVRSKALQKTFHMFFNKYPNGSQILCLGSGFDPTYFRLSQENSLPSNCIFFEVDFPEVMRRKYNIIMNNEKLKNCLSTFQENQPLSNNHIVLSTDNYKMIGCNLRALDVLDQLLDETGLKFDIPTLIITECVLTYLEEKSSSDVINWAAKKFQHAIYFTYEQIHPEDSFGSVMINHFKCIGSPLLSIHDYPTASSQIQRYLRLGWDDCMALDMNHFMFSFIDKNEHKRINKLEPFDEFEELHLKCNHYMSLWAFQGECKLIADHMKSLVAFPENNNHIFASPMPASWKSSFYFANLVRFGHASVNFSKYVLTLGGFGTEKGHHQRLSTIHCLNRETHTYAEVRATLNREHNIVSRMHHTATVLKSQNGFLVFGGRTSPMIPCSSTVFFSFPSFGQVCEDLDKLTPAVTTDTFVKSSVSCTEIKTNGEIPEPRWRHSASSLEINGVECLVVFGGRCIKEDYSDDCYILNTSSWAWKKLPFQRNQPSPRHSHSAATWQGNVIISCGLGNEFRPLDSVYSLNCTEMLWQRLDIKNINARYSHSSHIYENKLYLLGGVNCNQNLPAELGIVDLTSLTCKEYFFISTIPLPVLLHNHSSIIDEGKKEIILLGGGGNCFSFGTHMNLPTICLQFN